MISADVQTAIQLFAEMHPEYADPSQADGKCGLATDEFLELLDMLLPGLVKLHEEGEVHFTSTRSWARQCRLDNDGIPYFRYTEPDHHWYHGGLTEHNGHIVACIDGVCIDWTARQFRADAPWPLIFPIPKR